MIHYPKRLIEVDLPIKKISEHARREKSIRHGHISTLHIWWARRPLAACRAVLCAALWPDPADPLCPPAFVDAAREEMDAFYNALHRTNRDCADPLMLHIRPDQLRRYGSGLPCRKQPGVGSVGDQPGGRGGLPRSLDDDWKTGRDQRVRTMCPALNRCHTASTVPRGRAAGERGR